MKILIRDRRTQDIPGPSYDHREYVGITGVWRNNLVQYSIQRDGFQEMLPLPHVFEILEAADS